ncbi:MAG TPA: ATP-binding protein [Bryobacteraceae bacterium]|nr:ATP-binding protein [Bryobacteraceae bacterium]
MAQDVESVPIEITVECSADVRKASVSAKSSAGAIGFPADHCEEVGLVVTELGANLLRHASSGKITVSATGKDDRKGIRIESEDSGPGILDVEQAMTDGYSTIGGLGLGLGTVNRLMDELDIYPGPRGGTHIICQRYLRPKASTSFDRVLAFGTATRPRRPMDENGDAFIIKQWEGNALLGVIDGLGHGQFAQRASRAARQYVEQHFDQPLEKLFRGAGRVCRGTRGVVMALACVDHARAKLRVASVGNIEVRYVGGSEHFSPVVRRGIVGLNAPEAVVTEHAWNPGSLLIMHSDGLSTRWDWNDFSDLAREAPEIIAQRLMRKLGKPDDDATVVVARSSAQ